MENKIEILNNYRESKYPMTEMTEAFKLLEIEFLNFIDNNYKNVLIMGDLNKTK